MDALEVSNSTIEVDVASPNDKLDGDLGSNAMSEDEVEQENVQVISHKKKKARRQRHRVPKIFQDSISVLIPIDVRADLKIAIQKTRSKRIKSIHKRFPSLKKELKKDNAKDDSFLAEDVDGDENTADKAEDREQAPKQKNKLAHVPQREQYSSVVDYLEAKYVRGVMVQDEEDELVGDEMSEGQGSVYSGGSFLDDTDLQRDVAEQYMANTTMTKLELEDDDADFFVNVGNLEVEGNEYGEQYDPLQDKDTQASKSAKPTKKRKKVQPTVQSSPKKAKKTEPAKKKAAPVASPASTKTETKEAGLISGEDTEYAKQTKGKVDEIYNTLVDMIKNMGNDELPRRITKRKVALTCPEGKKPGDDVTFSNPHNPGQRLKVKIPQDTLPGGTFRVTVPVKQPEGEEAGDQNKLPKDFKDLLDDYARAYDEWCKAQSAIDKGFGSFKEKQKKFEKLVAEFPSSLVTPVDSEYLKLVVRRVRQYKLKKKRTQELKEQVAAKKESEKPAVEEEQEVVGQEEPEEEEPEPPAQVFLKIPTTGVQFDTVQFDIENFVEEGYVLQNT